MHTGIVEIIVVFFRRHKIKGRTVTKRVKNNVANISHKSDTVLLTLYQTRIRNPSSEIQQLLPFTKGFIVNTITVYTVYINPHTQNNGT